MELQNKRTVWLYFFSDSRLKLLGVSGLLFYPQPNKKPVLLSALDHIWMYQWISESTVT